MGESKLPSGGLILQPCILTIFGASGDLTKRLLVPAIYNLASVKALPEDFRLLGVANEKWDDAKMRSHITDALNEFWGDDPNRETVDWIVERTYYQQGDLKQDEAYKALAERIKKIEGEMTGGAASYLFYLALGPELIDPVASHLAGERLFEQKGDRWSRLIIEKPFGHDRDSAIQLTKDLKKSVSEDQIYRIDHFGGKEAVHDIPVVRFSNAFLDGLWNRDVIDNVQISVTETLGVEKRASFYEKSGALRDMVPNHLAELLSMVAMERPESREPDEIRGKQVDLLKAVKPPSPEDAVRGQYTKGVVQGKPAVGYREEPDVAPDSKADTYVAIKIEIDNDRWRGVPFYLRTGKRLAANVTEVVIEFKQAPDRVFELKPGERPIRRALSFRLQPGNRVFMEFGAKEPGMETKVVPAEMSFDVPKGPFGKHGNGYERLLRDAIAGNKTLFQREDFVEAGWRMVQPLLDAWSGPAKLATYAAGSSGPAEADELLARDGRSWRSLERE